MVGNVLLFPVLCLSFRNELCKALESFCRECVGTEAFS